MLRQLRASLSALAICGLTASLAAAQASAKRPMSLDDIMSLKSDMGRLAGACAAASEAVSPQIARTESEARS